MNEEEKQAIECEIELKYVTNKEFNINECFYILKKRYFSDDTELKAINYLEQFIDKQQKEIEELKIIEKLFHYRIEEIEPEIFISKDEIKELREKIHQALDVNGITRAYQLIIDDYFEKLLGEKTNE